MRVGLVRNAGLGMVALIGLGLAGCDDDPTDFGSDETVAITTNPSTMILPAGVTSLLTSRTENAGNEPTWEEITASVDATCGAGAVTVDVAASFEPSIQPPGVFDVTAGNTLGETCIQLTGGGTEATVNVVVVGDSMVIADAPATGTVNLFETADLSAVLLSDGGDVVSPFDPDADLTWSTSDEAVMTVDPVTGVVSAIGVGSADITATWTNAGASVSEAVSLVTNAPTLNIIDPANDPPRDSLLIDTSVDLTAELVDPTDPPATFGPFDPDTDVEWSTVCIDDRDEGDCDDSEGDPSQNNGVISVDAVTGEVTALGPGTAPVIATWTESVVLDDGDVVNNPVDAQISLTVNVPAPTITLATQAGSDLGDMITLTGTGFHPSMNVVVDENAILGVYEPTVVDATTVTFHLPFGPDGEFDVQVGAPGQLSNVAVLDREIVASKATEPANNSRATAPPVTFPLDLWGTVDVLDQNDRFLFSLAAETTIEVFLDWSGASDDLDLLWVDSPPTAFQACTSETATGAHPETGTCTFGAGDYTVEVNSFDEESAVYHLVIDIVP